MLFHHNSFLCELFTIVSLWQEKPLSLNKYFQNTSGKQQNLLISWSFCGQFPPNLDFRNMGQKPDGWNLEAFLISTLQMFPVLFHTQHFAVNLRSYYWRTNAIKCLIHFYQIWSDNLFPNWSQTMLNIHISQMDAVYLGSTKCVRDLLTLAPVRPGSPMRPGSPRLPFGPEDPAGPRSPCAPYKDTQATLVCDISNIQKRRVMFTSFSFIILSKSPNIPKLRQTIHN